MLGALSAMTARVSKAGPLQPGLCMQYPSPVNALSPLQNESLVDQVADRIVSAITTGRLRSGDRLIETEVAASLAVSRVPVREALRILCSQGLVEAVPRRGMRVAQFDAAWAAQLRDIRLALERLCLQAACPILMARPAARAELDLAVERIAEAADGGDPQAVIVADLAFHGVLFRLADSPLLATLWRGIARHVLVMFSLEIAGGTRALDLQRVVAQHRSLLERLTIGPRREIDAAIENHIVGARPFVFDPSSRHPRPEDAVP